MTGAVDCRGSRNEEERAATKSLLPADTCPQSMDEHRPDKVRPSLALASPMRCKYFAAPGIWCPLSASSASTAAIGLSRSLRMLTQTPMVGASSREEEAKV